MISGKFNKQRLLLIPIATLILALFTFLSLTPQNVYSCDCSPPEPPLKALENSRAVFVGKVADINQGPTLYDGRKVTFSVEQKWKGDIRKTTTISTPSDGAACGFPFEKGGTYIVCADGQDSLGTGLCSRTKSLSLAEEDTKELGPGEKPLEDLVPPASYIEAIKAKSLEIQFVLYIITYTLIYMYLLSSNNDCNPLT